MNHDWTYTSFCGHCGYSMQENVDRPADCPGPKPAGNTGRHEDSILWDRLRADLANLGASYGELPSEPIWVGVDFASDYEPDPLKLAAKGFGVPAHATSQRRGLGAWIERATDLAVMAEYSRCLPADVGDSGSEIITGAVGKEAEGWGSEPEPKIETADDWWAYKQRCMAEDREASIASGERVKALCVRLAALKRDVWEPDPASDTLSKAIARPLDWEPRLGWKPGDCE
jgi:hypothetical protein